MGKAIFLDRDGVLNVDVHYLYRLEDFQWMRGAKEALRLAQDKGYRLIVVTNQSGVGRGYFQEEDVQRLHTYMAEELKAVGVTIDAFYYCPHWVGAKTARYDVACACRKPQPGMILQGAQDFAIDLGQSLMIGDKESDMEAAARAGVRGYRFTGSNLLPFMESVLTQEEQLRSCEREKL